MPQRQQQSSALPSSILVDGHEVNISDLEQNALFNYIRADPENNRSAKRCNTYPEKCIKGADCTFAHLKPAALSKFLSKASSSRANNFAAASSSSSSHHHHPRNNNNQHSNNTNNNNKRSSYQHQHHEIYNPYADKDLLEPYLNVPEIVMIDGASHSIHELEPTALFNYLRQHPDKNAARQCMNFPSCSKGKDCSFAHLKAARLANNNRSGTSDALNNEDANQQRRALAPYQGLPSHVLVDGHHMSIHDLEPNNLFNYFLQHNDSPTAKRCQAYPFCSRGKDCSFGHIKSIKIKVLEAARERQNNNNNKKRGGAASKNSDNTGDDNSEEYRGLPRTVIVDSVIVSIFDLEPSRLFDYLHENHPNGANGDATARRCTLFPDCPRGRTCGFAHVKYAKAEAATTFKADAKPSAADYNGLPEYIAIDGKKISSTDLEPTLLFDYIRLHPDADNIKKCRNFPYCRAGRTCGYAHVKADRSAAISGMPAYLTIEDEQVDVLKELHPTAMFSYARKHPESNSFKWCKHWPKCDDGDACTYAHRKQ